MDEPPRVATPPEDEQVGKVGQGGTARLGLPASLEPACLNPYRAACRGAEALTGAILEAPLVVAPSVEYRPLLAEAVPSYETGTLSLNPFTVEIRLRAGTNFSDGEPLTSADVEWTYEEAARLAGSGGISPLYAGFGRLARVETPDERTARLVFREPYAPWRDLLTAPILPRHVYGGRSLADLTLNEEPVGSGPFVLEGRSKGSLSLIDTPRYWVEEPAYPNLEGVEIRYSDPRTIAEGLSAGRSDFGFFPEGASAAASGDLLRAAAAPTRIELLLFNSRRLEDRAVREDLARAVDRERMAGEVGGGAPVAQSFVPPGFYPGYRPAWERYDGPGPGGPQTDGGDLDLVYPAEAGSGVAGVARAVVSDLSAAGFEVEARPVSPGTLYAEVLPEGDFDLALYTATTPSELGAFEAALPPESGLKESLAAPDAEEQARRLAVAQERMAEEVALLPLFVWPDTYAWSSALYGPRPDASYRGLAWNAREWGFYE